MVEFDEAPSTPEQDRDSVVKTLGLDAILAPEDIGFVRLRLGFQRSWNDSDGSDFRYGSMGGYAGVNLSLPGLFNVDTVYSRTRVDYTEENSLAFNGVILGAFPRHDFVDRWNVRITRGIVRGVTGFGEYTYTDNESNIGAFSYHQNIWKIGALARF